MIGLEFVADSRVFAASDEPPALEVVNRLHERGLLTVPALPTVIRLLPPLNISREHAANGLAIIAEVIGELNGH